MTNERRGTCDCNKHLCLFLLSSRRSRGAWIEGDDSWTTTPDQARNITGASHILKSCGWKWKWKWCLQKESFHRSTMNVLLNNAWLQFSLSYCEFHQNSIPFFTFCLSVCGRNCDIVPFLHNIMWYKYKHTDTYSLWFFKSHSSNSATKNPDGEILETKRAFRDPLVSFSMPFEIMGLMYHWAGHTAWAPKGRKEQSLAGPKDRQLEVWAQRASRLLCAIFVESRGYNDIQILPLTFLYLFSDFSLSLFVPTFFRRFFRLFCIFRCDSTS